MSGEMTEREIEQLRDLCRRAEPYMVRLNIKAQKRYIGRGTRLKMLQETRKWLDAWKEMQE